MSDNRTSELFSCPFCGGEAEIMEYDGVYLHGFWIHCANDDCPNIAETDIYLTKSEAVEAWNTRYHYGLNDEDYSILLDELGVSERTCHVVKASRKYVLSDGMELFEDGCSECNGYLGEDDNYCSNCGAEVVQE